MTIEQRAQEYADKVEVSALPNEIAFRGYLNGDHDRQELDRIELEKVKAQLASLLEVADELSTSIYRRARKGR